VYKTKTGDLKSSDEYSIGLMAFNEAIENLMLIKAKVFSNLQKWL